MIFFVCTPQESDTKNSENTSQDGSKISKIFISMRLNTRVCKNDNATTCLLARRAIRIPNTGDGIFRDRQIDVGNGTEQVLCGPVG